MVVRIGGIRKFTFDVSDKNGTAHREFGRDQVEFVRLQNLRKMTGKGIGKRGRLALVFYLRVIIVCRRLSTTHSEAAVKGHLAFGLGGKIQGIIHIELILKDERERGNFIGQEERESTFSRKTCNFVLSYMKMVHGSVKKMMKITLSFDERIAAIVYTK